MILPSSKHITSVRVFPDFTLKETINGEEAFGPKARTLVDDVRVYLTDIPCKGKDCSAVWSSDNVEAGKSFYCGKIDENTGGADGEFLPELVYDVSCDPRGYGVDKYFSRVLLVRQTAKTTMFRQKWDSELKKFGVPDGSSLKPRSQEKLILGFSEVQVLSEESMSEAIADIEEQITQISSEMNQLDQVNIAVGAKVISRGYAPVGYPLSKNVVAKLSLPRNALVNSNTDGLDRNDKPSRRETYIPRVGGIDSKVPNDNDPTYPAIVLRQNTHAAQEIQFVRLTNGVRWEDKDSKVQDSLDKIIQNFKMVRVFQTNQYALNKKFWDTYFTATGEFPTTPAPTSAPTPVKECKRSSIDELTEQSDTAVPAQATFDCSGNTGYKYVIVALVPKNKKWDENKYPVAQGTRTFILTEIELITEESFHDHINTMSSQIGALQHDVSDLIASDNTVNLALGANVKASQQAKTYGGPSILKNGVTDGDTKRKNQNYRSEKTETPFVQFTFPKKERHVTNVRLYPDFTTKKPLSETEEMMVYDQQARSATVNTLVFLTDNNCVRNQGKWDCSSVWSQDAFKSKTSYYCGKAAPESWKEITGEDSYDVNCDPNAYAKDKVFKSVVLVKQTKGQAMYRQGPWDAKKKFFSDPVLINNPNPADKLELAFAEVEIMAKETVSEAISDIEDQISAQVAEISDLHAQADTFNLAVGARLLTQTNAKGWGGKNKIVDGYKVNPDPVTGREAKKTDVYHSVLSESPYIIFDLKSDRRISHVRLYPNHMTDDVFSALPNQQIPKFWNKRSWGVINAYVYLARGNINDFCPMQKGQRNCSKLYDKNNFLQTTNKQPSQNPRVYLCGVVGDNEQDDNFATSYDKRCWTNNYYNKVIILKATKSMQGKMFMQNKTGSTFVEPVAHPLKRKTYPKDRFSVAEIEIFAEESVSELIVDFENTVEQLKGEIVDSQTATDTVNLALGAQIWKPSPQAIKAPYRNFKMFQKTKKRIGNINTKIYGNTWVLKDGQKTQKKCFQ